MSDPQQLLRLPSAPRPPRPRRPPALPRGPRFFSRSPVRVVGPGQAPPGFAGATTSTDEWPPYWALATIFKDPLDPREPPFIGARSGVWFYQSFEEGARRLVGGANVDFEARFGGLLIGIRIQSERYHIFASSRQQSLDEETKRTLSRFMKVIDIFSQDYLPDESGQTVIILVKDALAGIERISPIIAGTARRTRAG